MSDRVVAAGLAALVIVARLPFATHTLWAWDSVLYARALEQGFHVGVDLADQRPHPPGYLFYVGGAAAARLFTGDSNAALVVTSQARHISTTSRSRSRRIWRSSVCCGSPTSCSRFR